MRVCTDTDICIEAVEPRTSLIGKTKGLMFESEGRVLLRFNQPDRHGIWMVGMRFSLDIVFIDADQTIIDLKTDVPPVSRHPGTWKIYRPSRMCKDVLEVEAGLIDEKDISIGDQVRYET